MTAIFLSWDSSVPMGMKGIYEVFVELVEFSFTRVGTMTLFSWDTAESQFSLSVGSSESQKTSFGKIWASPTSATRQNVNLRFLI